LREPLRGVCGKFEARLVEMDGEEDLVHLLVDYPPKTSVCSLVNSLEGSLQPGAETHSTRHREKVLAGALCGSSYFAASGGGAPARIVHQ